jgi:hypothetical protein
MNRVTPPNAPPPTLPEDPSHGPTLTTPGTTGQADISTHLPMNRVTPPNSQPPTLPEDHKYGPTLTTPGTTGHILNT